MAAKVRRRRFGLDTVMDSTPSDWDGSMLTAPRFALFARV
jgi:hypothetical protein